MTGQEKVLYHQIHPLKLCTDWSTGAVSFYLLWQRRWRPALMVMFAPAVVVSAVLIRWADLEPQKHSGFGQYVMQHMTRPMQAVRFAGNLVMMVGAWYRRTDLLLAGLLVILFGWLRGVLFPRAGAVGRARYRDGQHAYAGMTRTRGHGNAGKEAPE